MFLPDTCLDNKDWIKPLNIFQEYMLTSFHKIERQNLRWLERNQKQLKADKYQGIHDAIHGQDDLSEIGQKVILPATHTCSPRWYQQKF